MAEPQTPGGKQKQEVKQLIVDPPFLSFKHYVCFGATKRQFSLN